MTCEDLRTLPPSACLHFGKFSAETISFKVQEFNPLVLVGEVSKLEASLHDVRRQLSPDLDDDEAQIVISAACKYDEILILFSKDTVPAFKRIAGRINTMLQEQRRQFEQRIARLEDVRFSAKQNIMSAVAAGTVLLHGKSMSIALFRNSLMDQRWLGLQLTDFELNFAQKEDEKHPGLVLQELILNLDKAQDKAATNFSVSEVSRRSGFSVSRDLSVKDWCRSVFHPASVRARVILSSAG